MINGRRYAWEDIAINFPHGDLIDVDAIEYSDKKEGEPIYGKGAAPRGWGRGNYSAEAKVTLLREEFNKLVEWARGEGGSIYDLDPFTITVSYENDDEDLVTDTLSGCVFTENSGSSSQGDTSVKRELSVMVLNPIEWDGLPGVNTED